MSKILNNLDLTLCQLQNAKFHLLAAPPTGYEGLSYFNTATYKVGVFANSTWRYMLTDNLLAAVGGIATLDGSSKTVQDPASAATTSGGATGKIPISSTGGRLDSSYIPLLHNIPAPTASLAMNSQAITGLLDPTNPQDAATKNYVDTAVQGLDTKASVRCASIGVNITKTNTQTIDTIALSIGDRVLLKDQTAPAENGIWIVSGAAWTRALDCNSWAELVGAFVFVEGGATNADSGWVCAADPGGTLESTAVTWTQFSSAGNVTAANVGTGTGTIYRDKVGTVINFKTLLAGSTKVSITNNANDVTLDVNEGNLVFANMTNSGTLTVLKGGTGSTTSTGTAASAVVLANTPTLITPILGVATMTSMNKVAITQPATSATLTLYNGSTLATSGAYSITLTAGATTSVSLPASGTLLSTAAAVTVGQGGTGAGTVAGAKTALGFMSRYAADIGNGVLTSIPVTHNLGTLDVSMHVYLKSNGEEVYPDKFATDINTSTFVFAVAPTSNQYRVIIVG